MSGATPCPNAQSAGRPLRRYQVVDCDDDATLRSAGKHDVPFPLDDRAQATWALIRRAVRPRCR